MTFDKEVEWITRRQCTHRRLHKRSKQKENDIGNINEKNVKKQTRERRRKRITILMSEAVRHRTFMTATLVKVTIGLLTINLLWDKASIVPVCVCMPLFRNSSRCVEVPLLKSYALQDYFHIELYKLRLLLIHQTVTLMMTMAVVAYCSFIRKHVMGVFIRF